MKLKVARRLFTICGLVLILASLVTLNAQADGISFASTSLTTDTGDLSTATAFTSFGTVMTGAGTGIFSPIPSSTIINMVGFSFNPFTSPPNVSSTPNLWNVTISGTTYSFDMTTLSIDTSPRSSTVLDLSGLGNINITGSPTEPGSWTLTANGGGGTFSFSGSSSTVPEPATMLLLGSGLLGMGVLVRRRFIKK